MEAGAAAGRQEAVVWDGWLGGALQAPRLLGWWEPTAEEGLPPTQL